MAEPITSLLPQERNYGWTVLAPYSIRFYPETVVVEWREDALGNRIQPLLFYLTVNCCYNSIEFINSTGLFYFLQLFARRNNRTWHLRSYANAFQPEGSVDIFNYLICLIPPADECVDVEPGNMTIDDLSAQLDQWIIQSDNLYGSKLDFLPFNIDFNGCEDVTCPQPGLFIIIDGEQFFISQPPRRGELDPSEICELVSSNESYDALEIILTEHYDDTVDNIIWYPSVSCLQLVVEWYFDPIEPPQEDIYPLLYCPNPEINCPPGTEYNPITDQCEVIPDDPPMFDEGANIRWRFRILGEYYVFASGCDENGCQTNDWARQPYPTISNDTVTSTYFVDTAVEGVDLPTFNIITSNFSHGKSFSPKDGDECAGWPNIDTEVESIYLDYEVYTTHQGEQRYNGVIAVNPSRFRGCTFEPGSGQFLVTKSLRRFKLEATVCIRDLDASVEKCRTVFSQDLFLDDEEWDVNPPPPPPEYCTYRVDIDLVAGFSLPIRIPYRDLNGNYRVIQYDALIDLVSIPVPSLYLRAPCVDPTLVQVASAFIDGAVSLVIDELFDAALSAAFPIAGKIAAELIDVGISTQVTLVES